MTLVKTKQKATFLLFNYTFHLVLVIGIDDCGSNSCAFARKTFFSTWFSVGISHGTRCFNLLFGLCNGFSRHIPRYICRLYDKISTFTSFDRDKITQISNTYLSLANVEDLISSVLPAWKSLVRKAFGLLPYNVLIV